MNTLDRFLAELTELTKKYKIQIMGCGCCGSPCLSDVRTDEEEIINMKYKVNDEGEELSFTAEP